MRLFAGKYTANSLLLPTLVAAILFIPWLGEALFYSKGEPREAIVAVSMLDSGDWILPTSYGEDIPYKPPFMAWLIALSALIFNGGTVNEFISRLPSATFAIALLVATWRLVCNRYGRSKAWLTMIALATTFEFFRAATACRVDMILTTCTIGGLYALFTYRTNSLRLLWATLLFSGATLTKGPVGTLLPCLAMGIYFLLERRNFFKTVGQLTAVALASFVIPALWYWLAWRQGGDNFAALAWEENIGRLTGNMGYESHLNPWYYNITAILAGALPWTVAVLLALCCRKVRQTLRPLKKLRGLPLLAATVFLTVFVFYCLPASKRSVYLLPCYPFLAMGIAYILTRARSVKPLRWWANTLAVISMVAPLAVATILIIQPAKPELAPVPVIGWFVMALPLLAGGWWLFTRSKSANPVAGIAALTFLLMLTYNAAFMPMAVNPKSDKEMAKTIESTVPEDAAILTTIPEDSLLRYYSLNFYLHDRLRRTETTDTVGKTFWTITSVPSDTTRAILISKRSADTRRPVYLVRPRIISEP